MQNEPKKIPQKVIEQFLNGDDPMERIVNLDYKYQDNFITIFYRNEEDQKCTKKESFHPFVWATRKACERLCDGDRNKLKTLMHYYKIGVKKLSNTSIEGITREEFEDGYMFMFYAKDPMSYTDFLSFFKKCGNPIYSDSKNGNTDKSREKQYLIVTPQEQFLIATGKRFFKGYDDYDELLRMTFDLETTGLNTKTDRIESLGIRINRGFPDRPNGFEKVFFVTGDTEEEKNKSELKVIDVMFRIIYTFEPDIITAHNGENFDWQLIIDACERLGTTIEEVTAKYFDGESVRKDNKESILKLGGEIETYRQTIVPKTIVTDSLHAVRRAQAIDSNMQRADLKYATEYAGLKKENRVYTPGEKISEIYNDTTHKYAFNNTDGDWYIYDELSKNGVKAETDFETKDDYLKYLSSIKGKQGDKPFRMHTRNVLLDGYELVTGKYIIERYLMDDIYECDKVEWKFNSTNFLICKMLPVPYKKCTTMGTAGQWKALMMAWSYKYNLAIPPLKDTQSFTGGLSRLLKTGFVDDVIKLDYNSLYPSIILTWGISDTTDLLNSMLSFLEYVLTTREKYKNEKKKENEIIDKLKSKIIGETATEEEITEYNRAKAAYALADGKQSQMKVLGNSFFGSYGTLVGAMFPWKSVKCAEQTTCTGRQSLRLMISYFSTISDRYKLNDESYNYSPIVGDSFTGDTPLFIKYNDTDLIDIKPIEELIGKTEIDALGREYDTSKKSFKVLCRSGWMEPEYIYRHKTNKPIYEISDGNMSVAVTEDHSLYNDKQQKIKPSEITENTKLEYYNGKINNTNKNVFIDETKTKYFAKWLINGTIDRVPLQILNTDNKKIINAFLDGIKGIDTSRVSKTCLAGINFLKNIQKYSNVAKN